MKQVVRYSRVETFEVELEVIQPLTKATLSVLVNQTSSLGLPAGSKALEHRISEFKIVRASPECECSTAKGRAKR